MKKDKRKFLESLILSEIDKLTNDIDYEYSLQCSYNEDYILRKAEEFFGYNYEKDGEREEYCLKATFIETWQYWLEPLLPSLSQSFPNFLSLQHLIFKP